MSSLLDLDAPSLEYRIVNKELAKDLQCGICLQILEQPKQCKNGHLFCHNCIVRTITKNPLCPQCRCPLTEEGLSRSLYVEKHIRTCKVWCVWHFLASGSTSMVGPGSVDLGSAPPNAMFKLSSWEEDPEGCPEKMELQWAKKHEAECPFALLWCHYSKVCGRIRRRDQQSHLEGCPYRPTECRYCRLDVQFLKLDQHMAKCPQAPVQCTSGCGVELRRHELAPHLNNECPEHVLKCDFAEMGCELSTQRKHLQKHLQEKVLEHLVMFRKAYSTQIMQMKEEFNIELKKKDEKIGELEKIVRSNFTRLIWEIENWKTVKKKSYIQSKKFSLASYNWFIGFYTNGDCPESKSYISIYLFLDMGPQLPKGKSVTLEYCITFVNHKNPKKSITKDFKTTFPIKGGEGWGDRKAIRTNKLTDESGFLKDGALSIEAEINVSKVTWNI